MFKEHPRGLFVAFFANMGERFGYYTMLAIFVLFLQAKYGYDAGTATQIYGLFLAGIYFMPLIGGILADRVFGYGRTISLGMIVMFVGYFMMAVPTAYDTGLGLIISSLVVICIGTGLFKGNLQALVGNLYDEGRFSKYRDVAFNIFYMGINIGAMFAPTAAESVSNFILRKHDMFYKADIPALANKYLDGMADQLIGNGETMTIAEKLRQLAMEQPVDFTGLTDFSEKYLNTLSESYHYGFGVACISLIFSMLIFRGFRKYYKHADMTEKQKSRSEQHKDKMIVLSPARTRERLIALGLVFFVVIFFWMAFHQNGAAMTIFARDYTEGQVGKVTNLWFDLFGLLPVFLSVTGLIFMLRRRSSQKIRVAGGIAFVVFAALAYMRYRGYSETNEFTPQKFQHFNPFFIVVLTPVIIGMFNWLRKRSREPSAPKKIGIGMIITGLAFIILIICSLQLTGYSPREIGGIRAPQHALVSPYWLISTYLALTIAELFLSPMGISFVSRVSPPQYKGLMQGGWLAATAIGNYGVGLVGLLWDVVVPLWLFWGVLVGFCFLSAIFIFSVLKRLERAAGA